MASSELGVAGAENGGGGGGGVAGGEAGQAGKKRKQTLGSIDAFWQDFPRLHMAKQIFDGAIELFFLVIGAIAI